MNIDPDLARHNMVQQQIRCWNVTDQRVLDTFMAIPREHFVAPNLAAVAYADTGLPLDSAARQTMLAPQLEGRILQALNPQPSDRVLEIGTGSGFLTACLATLSQHVTSIDVDSDRIAAAESRIDDLGIANCDLQVQDVYQRHEAHTFDVIAVTGSIRTYDPRFEQWLRPGGRAFVAVGRPPAMEACLITRSFDGQTVFQSLFETQVPPLTIPGSTANSPFRF